MVNLDRLLQAEKVDYCKDFLRVKLCKVGTKSVYVDTVEFKILEAFIKTMDNQPDFENLKFSPVSDFKLSCDTQKVDLECPDNQKLEVIQDAL